MNLAKLRRSGIVAFAIFAALSVSLATPAAAAGPALNFSSDKAPDPMIVEDELTVAEHDRAMMGSALDYYDDSGEVSTLNASVNSSQTTPVGLRFDKIDASAFAQFPRASTEGDNDATWTKTTDWTKTSGASSSMTITDADTDGIEMVTLDASVATGETATATFASNVSIDDPNKRVLTFGGNVDQLTTSAEIEVRVTDAGGDYRYANITASELASDATVVANSTGNGYVYQSKINELPLAGSGNGALDEIQKVEIVSIESDSQVTISWLDVDRKGAVDLAEIERDTDNDGNLETTTITNFYEGGTADITGLSTLGETFDTATITDLSVYDVRYKFSDISTSSEYSTEFSSADDYSYAQQIELYGDLEVPAAIDLSHGAMSLEFTQGLPSERYVTFEVASAVDSAEAFGNVSESAYTDHSGSLNSQGSTSELVASASADTTHRVHAVILLQNEEVETLQSGAAMGPTGSSSSGFFGTIWGKIAGVGGAIFGAAGLSRVFGNGGN